MKRVGGCTVPLADWPLFHCIGQVVRGGGGGGGGLLRIEGKVVGGGGGLAPVSGTC